ncbi:ABC transporter substrate-binding protein [Bordetella bronchiseptica]|uniref:ABC transporter substrate-binding protein n=1 Tax=Bordetella bronchiseptica TaxID=518 RepID=UPI00049FF199|nr:ABC transporter substrate-binding protein [Bordetella bronchiseptica]AWQ05834.1 ABC transporter substrate-binding protein [Bordetella bronchiseptica]KDD54262.1 NMT1/THI5-like protein [Bordetella bronchiseptica OSU553]
MLRRNLIAVLSLLIVAAAVRSEAAEPVKFATGVDAVFLPLVIAVDKGYAKQRGVDAAYKQFASGAMALEAVVAGDADVAMSSEISTLGPRAKGAKIKTVARGAYSKDLIGLAAISGINGAQDLVGKSVAYPKGTAGEYYMDQYFQHYGISRDALKLVNVATPEMVPLLARGDVQAIFAWEPWFSRARSVVKDFKVVEMSGQNGIYTMQFLTNFSEKFLRERPEDVKKTLLAIGDATRWLNDPNNAAEAAAVLSRVFKVPEADAPRQFEQLKYRLESPEVLKADLVRAGGWLKDKGLIESADVAGLVDGMLVPDVLRSVPAAVVNQ